MQGELRTCVSRAYYSLFLLSRERVKGALTPKQLRKDIHKNVISEVKRRHLTLGNQLDRLRWLRVEADYHLIASQGQFMNWDKNWRDAEVIATAILPKLRRI